MQNNISTKEQSFQEEISELSSLLPGIKKNFGVSPRTLRKEIVLLRLANFAKDFLNEQNRDLLYELVNNARDIKKIKFLNDQLEKHNELSGQAEKAIINILEDAAEYEKNLKEERDRARAVSASIGEGVLVVDKNYQIILINRKAEELLGISQKEALGKEILEMFDVLQGDKAVPLKERPVVKTLEKGDVVSIEIEDNFYYQVFVSGRKFPIRLTVSPLKGNGITGAVMVFADVSREKSLEEARAGFISTASHQLRTPLTAIRWYSEILQGDEAGVFSAEQKSFLEQIHNSALRLNDIINFLLNMARLEGGQIKVHSSRANIFHLTENLVKELNPLLREKKLHLDIEIDPKEAGMFEIVVDDALLSQVIGNLLSNAIRYTNENGSIKIKIGRAEKEFIYSIKDDGIGIPKNQKGRVFEKFFRAANAVSKIPDGNGLGLSLVKRLVETLGGKVWFSSEENKGAIFYFTIPIVSEEPIEMPVDSGQYKKTQ